MRSGADCTANTIVLDSLQSQGELYPIGLTLPHLYRLQTAIRDRYIVLVPLRWELRVWQIDCQAIRLG